MAADIEDADDFNGLGMALPGLSGGAAEPAHFPRLWDVKTYANDEASGHDEHSVGTRVALLAKDVTDRILALAGLVCLLPLLLLIGLAVRSSSPGPALFRHERIGRHGKPFKVWKFRTMRQGSDAELQRLLAECGRDVMPLFKVPCDPRVTPLGRFLRAASLDELPQLLNVLTGQMSLVGPRPQVAAEVALYAPHERLRLQVKPGLTGLWQVSGRSSLTWQQAVEFDLRYVREWSLLLDVKILIRTVRVVLRREGAI